MKKKLLLVAILLVATVALTGCGKGSKKPMTTISENIFNYFTIKADVEEIETKDGNKEAKYNFTKEAPEKAEYRGASYYLATDKVVLAIKTNTYAFHTSLVYKGKHGTVTPSWALFKEYVMSDEYTGTLKNVEETEFAGLPAMKAPYEYTDSTKKINKHGYQYIISIEKFNPTYKGYVTLVITTAEGETGDIDKTLEDEEVKELISSIKLVEKE